MTTTPSAEALAALERIDDFIARCNGDDRGSCADVNTVRAHLSALEAEPKAQAIEVWFGSMPESNGRENWTVTLRRKDRPKNASKLELHRLMSGVSVYRSEYKDRARYEADRLRFLLGETDTEPCILDYDADLHSGYAEPKAQAQAAEPIAYYTDWPGYRAYAAKPHGWDETGLHLSDDPETLAEHWHPLYGAPTPSQAQAGGVDTSVGTALELAYKAAKFYHAWWSNEPNNDAPNAWKLSPAYAELEAHLVRMGTAIDKLAAPEARETAEPVTYSSTQATKCAGCGKHKHTPLRIDAMGGYVCLTCIDQKLGSLLGEFGYPEPEGAAPASAGVEPEARNSAEPRKEAP